MIAREFAEDLPTVGVDDDALEAARLLATRRLPGVVVLDGVRPVAVLPATAVLGFVVPGYVQDDPSLAGVFDEHSADECATALRGRRVRDLLPRSGERAELAAVEGGPTVLECAAMMARLRAPLLLVADGEHQRGVVTASRLLEIILPAA